MSQRITRQHFRCSQTSTLRRTLLAVLLPGDPSWRNGAALDVPKRLVLASDEEKRLTVWMHRHMLLGWVPYGSPDEVCIIENHWICNFQPAVHSNGTKHRAELDMLKRTYREGLLLR